MILFLGGVMVGMAVGLILAALFRANDDDCSRGHPM